MRRLTNRSASSQRPISPAVADRKDLNDVRIRQLMTTGPAIIGPMTSIRDAAQTVTSYRFRHLGFVNPKWLHCSL